MNIASPSRHARFLCAALLATLSATFARAEMFTLTDKQGRSIKANVISVEGDQVKIKREDGQTFNVSLATLADADQKKLKAWAAANPTPVTPDDLLLQFSRAKFDTEKQETEGHTAYKEKWGYSIDLANKSKQPLDKLRAEYILFVKQDNALAKDSTPALKRVKAAAKIDPIPLHGKLTFRTEAIDSYRYVLKPGYYWTATGNTKPVRDTLEGMWLRIYSGDQLVLEKLTPETLAKTEKW